MNNIINKINLKLKKIKHDNILSNTIDSLINYNIEDLVNYFEKELILYSD